jgi:hypothetical protein
MAKQAYMKTSISACRVFSKTLEQTHPFLHHALLIHRLFLMSMGFEIKQLRLSDVNSVQDADKDGPNGYRY